MLVPTAKPPKSLLLHAQRFYARIDTMAASPKEWLASYVAEKERERRDIAPKSREEAAARKAKQLEDENRAKRIANLRDVSSIGASVYSAKYGICTITGFRLSSNGKFEYVSISTPEGIKEFPFPDCFESGFLSN